MSHLVSNVVQFTAGIPWDRGEHTRGALVGRLPRPLYEPPIVTTLRYWHGRRASLRFLHRLVGGAEHYRAVNLFGDIDGGAVMAAVSVLEGMTAPAAAVPIVEGITVTLSAAERRIAVLQILADCSRRGRPALSVSRLAVLVGASEEAVGHDINWLRGDGTVTTSRDWSKTGSRNVHLSSSRAGANA